MSGVKRDIIGREEELASLCAWLGAESTAPRGYMLEGGAGIGKSTLWLAGVEAARERGLRVLVSRPAEAERDGRKQHHEPDGDHRHGGCRIDGQVHGQR